MSTTANPEAWARLEILLSAMHPGEVITTEEAVVQTGIGMESAALVLDALVEAALFERHGHHFVRLSLFDHDELQRAFGSCLPQRQSENEQEQSARPRRRLRASPRRPDGA